MFHRYLMEVGEFLGQVLHPQAAGNHTPLPMGKTEPCTACCGLPFPSRRKTSTCGTGRIARQTSNFLPT